MGMDKFRPRAVVLLSSEPCAASDNAYNYANQWEKPSFLAARSHAITPFSDRTRSTIPKKNRRLLAV